MSIIFFRKGVRRGGQWDGERTFKGWGSKVMTIPSPPVLQGLFLNPFKDLLMAQVDPVKVTQGNDGLLKDLLNSSIPNIISIRFR